MKKWMKSVEERVERNQSLYLFFTMLFGAFAFVWTLLALILTIKGC